MREMLFVLRNLDLLMGSHLILQRIPKSRKIAAFWSKKITQKSPSAPAPYNGNLSKDNYPRKSNKAKVYGITTKHCPNPQLLSTQWSSWAGCHFSSIPSNSLSNGPVKTPWILVKISHPSARISTSLRPVGWRSFFPTWLLLDSVYASYLL